MNKENINRLKKYLFLISIFFSFLIWSHIIYIYLYDDAKEIPIEWWSVSEWIVGEFPHLNPLISSNDYNKNIIFMLYRSLLKYDFKNKKIIWDLANCDIKNLNKIECYLNKDIKWSNWKNITTDDVISTYNIIKNSDINPVMQSLIKDTKIESKNWIIVFTNKINDVNFLQVFFQPIVSKEILDNIWNKELFWKFNPMDWVYSWPYKVDVVSYDDSLWVQKLILTRNENYKDKNILISKYIYRIFRDNEHILKHKDLINIFFDKENIIWDSVVRLNNIPYSLNKYVSLFLNEDKIKNYNLRSFLLSKIDNKNILRTLWSNYKEAKNPYLLDWIESKFDSQNVNLENTIRENGFYKKDYLLLNLIQQAKDFNKTLTESKENKVLDYLTWNIINKYNFVSNWDLEIKGLVKTDNVEAIYINDYKLSSYKSWSKDFIYKLNEKFKNLKIWENNYKIYFQISWKKVLKEDFYIIYSQDIEKLNKIKETYFKTKPENTTDFEKNIDIVRKNKIEKLDNRYYYDYNLNKFSLKLYYINNNEDLYTVSNIIKNTLETYWILVEVLPLSLSDLNKKIISWEKDYDMILLWIDLWLINYNIYPYFHSSQSKWWFNFSNLKNLSLDLLLEDLKTHIFSSEVLLEKQKQAITIINDRKVFKPIYEEIDNFLIDKNIKNFKSYSQIPNETAFMDSIIESYVSEHREIIFSKKSISDFIQFIKKIF